MESDDTATGGVEPLHAAEPSLDRLKKLDSLPNLDAQLETAGQLCNQAHRAEMIIKWLLGKIQDQNAARNVHTWKLFSTCLRLVAPQRISVLLGRFDLLATVRRALENSEDNATVHVLAAVAQTLTTLVEISQGPDGAFVKRLLCLHAERTGTLLGFWIEQIDSLSDDELSTFPMASAIRTVTHIWQSRRPGASDDESFAKSCLVPCALLMHRLRAETTDITHKRKRGSSLEGGLSGEMELLLARHIFLPARTSFFRAHHSGDTESVVSSIEDTFATLSSAIKASDAERQKDVCAVLPLLLDIAVRCVPMTTSKQRTTEQPWVECVFQTLLNCSIVDRKGKLANKQAVTVMLEVIRRRASLSLAFFKGIVKQYSGLGKSAKHLDLELVAKVAELNANVFVDDALADGLFQALGRSSEVMGSSPNLDLARRTWRDPVAVPVLKAFAGSRKLDEFIRRWYGQLQSGQHWNVWWDLEDPVADLVELHLIEHHFDTIFDLAHTSLKLSKRSATESTPIRASSILLNALLKGARSDELRERMHSRLGHLFEDLNALVAKVKGIPLQVWELLARTFQFWFPSWAMRQVDQASVIREAGEILSSPTVKVALEHARNASVAARWIGQLCHSLGGYGDCKSRATEILEVHAGQRSSDLSQAFVAFPDLLPLLRKETRQQIFGTAMSHVLESTQSDQRKAQLIQPFATLLQYSAASSNTHLVEEIMNALLQPLSKQSRSEAMSSQFEPIMYLLASLPAAALSRAQRERIINALTDLTLASKSGRSQLLKELTAMIAMLQLPAATANVCTDSAVIWSIGALARPIEGKSKSKSKSKLASAWDATNLGLLEELAHLVLSHISSTQEQDRSRSMLKSLYSAVAEEMDGGKLKGSSVLLDRLVIVKVVVRTLQQNVFQETLAAVAVDFDATLVRFAERLAKRSQKLAEELASNGSSAEDDLELSVMLDLLATAMESKDVEKAAVSKYLPGIANAVLPSQGIDSENKLARLSAVQAARLVVSSGNGKPQVQMSSTLLQAGLSPKQRDNVLQTAQKALAHLPVDDRITLLADSLPPTTKIPAAESILVLQKALQSVWSNTLDQDETAKLRAILPALLSVLDQHPDLATYSAVFRTISIIVREKPFLLTQHTLESTLTTVNYLASLTTPASTLIYLDMTSLLSVLLTHHRARLQNRLHLLLPVLQTLQARLFKPSKPSTTSRKPLTARHARAFTRLLTLLCNPPTLRPRKFTPASANLVDESRRARAHVGQFVPTLLHNFCALLLTGTLGEGMREALTPGLWAVIESMEIRGAEGVKVLSAAMNGSERAVLRGVWEDWRRFGKWEGA